MNFQALKEIINPGDLILFKGVDFVSKSICKIETFVNGNGDYSHVGVVVNKRFLPTIEELKEDKLYILESTCTIPHITDGVPDVRTKRVRFGVQLRDLDLVVKMYEKNGGKVAWSKLKYNPFLYNKDIPKIMTKLINKIGYKKYDFFILDMFAAAFPKLRKARAKFEGFEYEGNLILSTLDIVERSTKEDIKYKMLFCSELVCMVYQEIGLIDKKLDPMNVMPSDYISNRYKELSNLFDKPIEIIYK